MTLDLEKLKEIAGRAPAGPWETSEPGKNGIGIGSDHAGWFAELRSSSGASRLKATAAHIAVFDPPTVLALIGELEKAKRDSTHWHECFQALEKAVVGETGASAIMTAPKLRAQRDAARALLKEAVSFVEGRSNPKDKGTLPARIKAELGE